MKKTKAYDELIDFIAGRSPRKTVSEFQPSKATKARVWELVARSKANKLNEEESLELDDYLVLEHILRLAKARSPRKLASRTKS